MPPAAPSTPPWAVANHGLPARQACKRSSRMCSRYLYELRKRRTGLPATQTPLSEESSACLFPGPASCLLKRGTPSADLRQHDLDRAGAEDAVPQAGDSGGLRGGGLAVAAHGDRGEGRAVRQSGQGWQPLALGAGPARLAGARAGQLIQRGVFAQPGGPGHRGGQAGKLGAGGAPAAPRWQRTASISDDAYTGTAFLVIIRTSNTQMISRGRAPRSSTSARTRPVSRAAGPARHRQRSPAVTDSGARAHRRYPLRHGRAQADPITRSHTDFDESLATELVSNTIRHTGSGRGGCFAVEITQAGPVVRVTVADSGGSAEPRMIDEPAPEHGKRLPLMRGLPMRTAVCGDDRGLWSGPISAGTARLQRPKRQDTMRPVLRSATASPRCRSARQRPGPGGPRCCVGHAQMRVGRCSQAPRAWSSPLTAGQLCGYRRVCSRPTHRCRRNRCAIIRQRCAVGLPSRHPVRSTA